MNSRMPRERCGSRTRRIMTRCDLFERQCGEVPLLYRRWYERIGRVDFSQAREQLLGVRVGPTSGLGLNCSLIFLDLPAALSTAAEVESDARPGIFVPTGAYASNCEPKGVWVPDSC